MEIAAPRASTTEAKKASKLAGSIRRLITPRKTPSGPFSRWAIAALGLLAGPATGSLNTTFDSPPENPLAGFMRAAAFTPFTPPFNVTGQPAISLPLGWTADGLPIGVQLVAAYGREDLLIRVAAQLEQAQPWADRRPPVSV